MYNFIFSFFNSNEDAKTLDCFVGFLRSQGAKAEVVHWNDIPGIVPGTYVTATGTFEMVAPALQFAIVAAYGVTCSDNCTGSFCPGTDSSTGSCSVP